jgi:hypothetical protein
MIIDAGGRDATVDSAYVHHLFLAFVPMFSLMLGGGQSCNALFADSAAPPGHLQSSS